MNLKKKVYAEVDSMSEAKDAVRFKHKHPPDNRDGRADQTGPNGSSACTFSTLLS